MRTAEFVTMLVFGAGGIVGICVSVILLIKGSPATTVVGETERSNNA